MIESQRYYTATEAAEILRLHPKTVRRYIRTGLIEAVRTPAGWRISQDGIDAYFGRGAARCASGTEQQRIRETNEGVE